MISRTSTPLRAGRSSRPSRRARMAVIAISSPVSRTKTSSRLAGRRSPSGALPLMRRTATDVPVRRVARPAARISASTSASRAGGP